MVTIRIDDVSPNTDFKDLKAQIDVIREKGFGVLAGVTMFAKEASNGAIYPELPLRNHPKSYFINVDKFIQMDDVFGTGIKQEEIASHGLIHTDHAKLSEDAQDISIGMSCKLLKTNRFISPFNSTNSMTSVVLNRHEVSLVNDSEWKSLESSSFDPSHPKWYYHPWRLNAAELKEKLK